jgi:hypothetical protein
MQPIDILKDEHASFIMQRKLVLKENEMMKEILNKEKLKEAIRRKGNVSTLALDKLTYPILK